MIAMVAKIPEKTLMMITMVLSTAAIPVTRTQVNTIGLPHRPLTKIMMVVKMILKTMTWIMMESRMLTMTVTLVLLDGIPIRPPITMAMAAKMQMKTSMMTMMIMPMSWMLLVLLVLRIGQPPR